MGMVWLSIGRAPRDDQVHLRFGQLGRQLRKAVVSSFRPPILEGDVPPLDPAPVAELRVEPRQQPGVLRGRCGGREMADPVYLPRLLRLGRESPGNDAKGQACDEGAPVHHLIELRGSEEAATSCGAGA